MFIAFTDSWLSLRCVFQVLRRNFVPFLNSQKGHEMKLADSLMVLLLFFAGCVYGQNAWNSIMNPQEGSNNNVVGNIVQ
jgi:hypothetical protein